MFCQNKIKGRIGIKTRNVVNLIKKVNKTK